jgi:hypothetical protein
VYVRTRAALRIQGAAANKYRDLLKRLGSAEPQAFSTAGKPERDDTVVLREPEHGDAGVLRS